MIVHLGKQARDDDQFLAAISSLIATAAKKTNVSRLYATRINNWFDHKWLRYSGKGRVKDSWMGALSLDHVVDLTEFSQDHLTFPPFNPNRVEEQHYWSRAADSSGQREAPPRLVHKPVHEHSAWNLQNRVSQFADSALFAWFSSNSKENGRASLMVYLTHEGRDNAWYASFVRGEQWKLD